MPAEAQSLQHFREDYLRELKNIETTKRFITDKMPQNFRFIGLILSAIPEAKVIHVKRSAAATCWSIYKKYFAQKGLRYSYNLEDLVGYYLLYMVLMKYWDLFHLDKIFHLNYDQLTIDQEYQTGKLFDYLGMEMEDACLSPDKNKRIVKTASLKKVRQKIYQGSSEEWRKFEPFLDGVFSMLDLSND